MDMFFFTKTTPRNVDTLIRDFEESAGSFNEFYDGMNKEEKILFKEYLEKLRVDSHSPLAGAPKTETTLSPLF